VSSSHSSSKFKTGKQSIHKGEPNINQLSHSNSIKGYFLLSSPPHIFTPCLNGYYA